MRRWLVLPLVFIVAGITAFTKAPIYLRAYISKPFLDRFAERCVAMPEGTPLPQPGWIGLYPVTSPVYRDEYGIYFELPTGGFCCSPDMEYSTVDLTKCETLHQYTHIVGNWYMTGMDW